MMESDTTRKILNVIIILALVFAGGVIAVMIFDPFGWEGGTDL